MADGLALPASGVNAATEDYSGGTRLSGYHRQEVVQAIAGAAASPTTLSVTTSSSSQLSADGLRHSYYIDNNTDTDIWLAFGAAAVVGSGIRVKSGSRITVGPEYAQFELRAIHGGTGTKTPAIQVFTV